MRIEFPHAAREDFHWAQARLRIGSAPENDLVLAAGQAAPQHLCLHMDRRGWVLEVLGAADRIHVNARPVRERALLRAGDVISVGACRMLLREDTDPSARVPVLAGTLGRCTVALRALGGPLSGRVLPVGNGLELGPNGKAPLELPRADTATLRLAWSEQQLTLEVEPAAAQSLLRVNGVPVGRTALQPGDQIALATHRFVLDAPGMTPEPTIVMPEPAPERLPEETAGPAREVWWLIVTAAVLALGIAVVLLFRF